MDGFPAAALARNILTALCVLCVLVQIFLNSSSDNIAASILAAISGIITFQYVLRREMFSENPISSIMILGLGVSTCAGALIFQTIYFRDITYNIFMPIETFGYPLLVTMLSIAAHFTYRISRPAQQLRREFS